MYAASPVRLCKAFRYLHPDEVKYFSTFVFLFSGQRLRLVENETPPRADRKSANHAAHAWIRLSVRKSTIEDAKAPRRLDWPPEMVKQS
jgi:hypothetical protein